VYNSSSSISPSAAFFFCVQQKQQQNLSIRLSPAATSSFAVLPLFFFILYFFTSLAATVAFAFLTSVFFLIAPCITHTSRLLFCPGQIFECVAGVAGVITRHINSKGCWSLRVSRITGCHVTAMQLLQLLQLPSNG
jgi:hypothetical protein